MGDKLKKSAIIYGIVCGLFYLIIAIILFVADDDVSGATCLGTIIDILFYAAIGYCVGDTLEKVTVTRREVKSILEIVKKDNASMCLNELVEQKETIKTLLEKIDNLEKKISTLNEEK